MISTTRLVKSEDLNHHGTLFAGRMAEWFVETSFAVAAVKVNNPDAIVCLNVHGLLFTRPVNKGDLIKIESRIVNHGKTSITVYCEVTSLIEKYSVVDGFVTFVHVDEAGNKVPHNLEIDYNDAEILMLHEKARKLR